MRRVFSKSTSINYWIALYTAYQALKAITKIDSHLARCSNTNPTYPSAGSISISPLITRMRILPRISSRLMEILRLTKRKRSTDAENFVAIPKRNADNHQPRSFMITKIKRDGQTPKTLNQLRLQTSAQPHVRWQNMCANWITTKHLITYLVRIKTFTK